MLYSYIFWLILISLFVFILERIFQWRKQKVLRAELSQDIFWLFFNGYFLAIIFNPVFKFSSDHFNVFFNKIINLPVNSIKFFNNQPFLIGLITFLILSDFLEWCVHNLLHKINWMWKFHRLHHSILIMDWIGNFRFHFVEVFIYKSIKYIPFAVFSINWKIFLTSSIIATLIGHLNHSNINITWGPFKYILNSPRMHIWHHEKKIRGKYGVNFGVVFSIWDWIFKTAYMPKENIMPKKIGFQGQKKVPSNIFHRFFLPFYDIKRKDKN